MPLKLNIGLSKKQGLPDYGSVGASCNVELELDSMALSNGQEQFHHAVQSTYKACRKAVDDELARQCAEQLNKLGTVGPAARIDQVDDLHPHQRRHNGMAGATEKQFDYIHRLSSQINGLGTRRLESLVGRMYDKPMVAISGIEASGLIDTLKAIKGGRVELESLLGETAK